MIEAWGTPRARSDTRGKAEIERPPSQEQLYERDYPGLEIHVRQWEAAARLSQG